jgi:GntR family transcriptional regulator of vanillate catabolism
VSDPKTRFEVALLRLREMILTGELPPGSRIQEVTIGKRLGVSRTPVRISLTVLEREGLVRGEPNRGFTVREFTVADVLAAYDVRSVLEGFACRLIAERGLSEANGLALDDCIREGGRLLQPGFFDAMTLRRWTEMNGRFHSVIVAASANPALANALDLVNKHPLAAPTSIVFGTKNLERLFTYMQQAQEDHIRVLAALRQGQAVRAEHLMADHIFKARENMHSEINILGTALPEQLSHVLRQAKVSEPNDERTKDRL